MESKTRDARELTLEETWCVNFHSHIEVKNGNADIQQNYFTTCQGSHDDAGGGFPARETFGAAVTGSFACSVVALLSDPPRDTGGSDITKYLVEMDDGRGVLTFVLRFAQNYATLAQFECERRRFRFPCCKN